MSKKVEMTKKIGDLFMEVGSKHVATLSMNFGFYEPKISKSLLKKLSNSQK